ncbi:HCO3 transporter family-domain-containing protein [Suillus cothurnatus]|nr:HCO3 transporter family-domain-containing protein [Suillus cothurnatus]
MTLYRNQMPVQAQPMEERAKELPGSSTLLQSAAETRQTSSFIRKLGAGIIADVRARIPWYFSDWTDAWNYRVVPATALIFFAKYRQPSNTQLPEVLISSFMAAFMFSILGAQPLTIAGVTGPITVFNRTIYDIINKQPDAPKYLHFVGWVYFWAAIIHWATAVLNSGSLEGALVGITLALLMLVTSFLFQRLSETTLFHRHIRRFFSDYGMPISLIATSGMAHWGRFNASNPTTLPVGSAFQAANGRAWLVKFWELDGKWVGIALPFGIILWILFFFDHNVSSLIAQGSQFPLRKPPGFHYDFFLLGITTFIAGLIGVPAPNGLIPQAPIHTASLLVMGKPSQKNIDEEEQITRPSSQSGSDSNGAVIKMEKSSDYPISRREAPIAVIEQRVSNLAQGSLCLVLLTGPFLHILGLVPRGVLAGLFWFMGADALKGNGITIKLLYLIRDKTLTSPDDPLHKVRKSRLLMFVAIQLVAFGATFVVTQSIAAIGFPVIILLLVPLRTYVIPRLPFTQEELSILDGPTASPFTMESVGGSLHTA